MWWVRGAIAAACILGSVSAAETQTIETVAPAAEPAALDHAPVAAAPVLPATITIPAGTTITVEFTETLSSRTSQTGQLVGLRLVEPVIIDGQTIVEAGAVGGGEVIDAARSGIGGRNGKLIVSGRYIEVAGQRARIRGLQVVIAGEDNSREAVNTMILVPYVGWMGGFITGGEIEIPQGTRAQARFTTDVVAPLPAPPATQAEPLQVEPAAAPQIREENTQ